MKKTPVLFILFLALAVFTGCKTEQIEISEVPERGFYSTRPAQQWEESLVTGNGIMGAMVEGHPYDESIVFNHALLYLPIHKPLKPVSQGKYLEEIQQMMLEGNYTEASQFIVNLANLEGYNGKHATDPFVPAFRVHITGDSTRLEEYKRSVNFSTGEVEVKWKDTNGTFSRKVFISRPDNIVVIRLRSNKRGAINTTLHLSQVTTYDMLTWLSNSYWNNNLVSTHDPGKTFNVDICGGYPSLIMKMLVYSEPCEVSLLPCLPKEWTKGSIKGVALRGGIILEELRWDEPGTEVTMLSTSNQEATIKLKGKDIKAVKLVAGESTRFTI